MIKAYKHGWPRWAVHRLIVRRTRRGFRQVRVQGLDRLRNAIRIGPADQVCRETMQRLVADRVPADDIAMLAVRRPS